MPFHRNKKNSCHWAGYLTYKDLVSDLGISLKSEEKVVKEENETEKDLSGS